MKEIILQGLIVISFLLLVGLVGWFIFGNSPTPEQILLASVVPLYIFMFTMYDKLNNRITSTRIHLQKEIGEIKQTLGRIEGKAHK